MDIVRCGLAIITRRGENVVAPTLLDMSTSAAEFLKGHVIGIRKHTKDAKSVRTLAESDSKLLERFEELGRCDDARFLEITGEFVNALASEMTNTPGARDCVVGVVGADSEEGTPILTFLKLDAQVEAAQLTSEEGKISLEVLKELLPASGDMQKGLSWPDPRNESDVIVVDANQQTTAKYFQKAFKVHSSPRPNDVEKALNRSMAKLGAEKAKVAFEAVKSYEGPVEGAIEKIREIHPEFDTSEPGLGGSGTQPGWVRANKIQLAPVEFNSDGITLRVPVEELGRVEVQPAGDHFITTISTTYPLGPDPIEPSSANGDG